jgi:hypothetical protein
MKKFLMITGISMVILTGCAYSQQDSNSLLAGGVASAKPRKDYMNDINTRAMRDFVSRYKDVTTEQWHKTNGNWVAVFFRDSVQYRVVYDKRGDLNFIMKYYEEPELARDVRARIKSVYFDYKIFIVQEIESPDHSTVYIVNLQGDTDWKKIKLCDGDIEVMEQYKKGK